MGNVKHFYNTADFPREEIYKLIDLAMETKKGKLDKSLIGKTLLMLFFNPSLRTRISFAAAMHKLGGLAIDLSMKEGQAYPFEFGEGAVMDKQTIEHVKEGACVLSRYGSAIAIRASELITGSTNSVEVDSWETLKKDTILKSFMKYSEVPVINMESNVYHPCQGLADAVTIVEKLAPKTPGGWSNGLPPGGGIRKKYVLSWVYHPKALPMATPNSQILAACDLGMEVIVVHPPCWEMDEEIISVMEKRAEESGGTFKICYDQTEAFRGADVVCAKSWGALKNYGDWQKEKEVRNGLKDWIVDKEKMSVTDNALFMHCLPVRRNVEVTDEVLDSCNSIVIDQAENRMWAQMALLLTLIK